MVAQAVATRDAMAKALYGALFDWIVDQVRLSMKGVSPTILVGNEISCLWNTAGRSNIFLLSSYDQIQPVKLY